MKNSIHAWNESITAICNTRGRAQTSKRAFGLRAGSLWLSSVLARFPVKAVSNASHLRAGFAQSFKQIVQRLTVWCETHEPNCTHRLGAWEIHASGLARELVERDREVENNRKAEEAFYKSRNADWQK